MRQVILFALLFALAGGCSKSKPTEPANPKPEPTPEPKREGPNPDNVAKSRTQYLNSLKSKDQKVCMEAADELVAWIPDDPETVNALLELMKDRTNMGLGKIMPTRRNNSTRQLAATTLNSGGPKGQAALKDRGLAILREGLSDPDAAVREHTVYTIGLLGSMARPLSGDVLKLCTNPDANVRGAAFDALRAIGVTDPVALTALLANENPDIVRLAAEIVVGLSDIPAAAVPNLTAALADKEPTIRTSVAAALARQGKNAAPATEALVKAINEHYPKEQNPMMPYEITGDAAYWRALVAIGEPAVLHTAGLLQHSNQIVRVLAAQTLGEIGAPSKAAADRLKDALKDMFADVAIEAACALCRIGEGKDEVVELVKRAMDAPNAIPQAAIEAIPRMGEAGKTLIPLAIAKLSSENAYARYAAVGLLGTLEPTEAAKHVPELGKLATDTGAGAGMPELETKGKKLIRLRVGLVLERLGPLAAPAADALGKAIPNETDPSIRDQFVNALIAMGAGAKPALPALLPIAADKTASSNRRARVVSALVAADPASKEVSEAVLAALGENDPIVRITAMSAVPKLTTIPGDALTKLVAIANTDKATNARVTALRALAAAGTRATPVRADVEKIANGPIPEFALAAKISLAAMDGNTSKVADDVRKGLIDKNVQVRAAAVEGLLLVGPEAADLPAIQKMLTEPTSTTKETAAKCVSRLGAAAKDAVPQLIKLLGDPDGNVRVAAATALGEIGPAAQPAVDRLKQMRGTDKRGDLRDPIAGSAAARALEKLGAK